MGMAPPHFMVAMWHRGKGGFSLAFSWSFHYIPLSCSLQYILPLLSPCFLFSKEKISFSLLHHLTSTITSSSPTQRNHHHLFFFTAPSSSLYLTHYSLYLNRITTIFFYLRHHHLNNNNTSTHILTSPLTYNNKQSTIVINHHTNTSIIFLTFHFQQPVNTHIHFSPPSLQTNSPLHVTPSTVTS